MLVETRRPTRCIEWAAGLLEGEGCMSFFRRKNRPRAEIFLAVSTTDKDTAEHLQEVLGGRVTGPYDDNRPPGNRKPIWRWQEARYVEVVRIIRAVAPYMGRRRSNDWAWRLAMSYFLTQPRKSSTVKKCSVKEPSPTDTTT